MFEIKKIISCFFYPASIVFILSLIFSFYFLKKDKKAFLFFLIISFMTYLLSSNFLWKFLICRIEGVVSKKASLDGDVISVFGGGVSAFYDNISNSLGLDLSGNIRLFAGYRVYKKTNLPIILSGGRVFNQESFSEISRSFLLSLGLRENVIHIDNISRDTYENVINTVNIAKKNGFKKIIVVSDAIHIPRIMLIFKKIGYNTSFYPSYYICSKFSWRDFVPNDMMYSNIFIHEFLGYIWYFLRY